MSKTAIDAIYFAITVVLAIVLIKFIGRYGLTILLIAAGYYIYKRFIKKDDDRLF